MAYLTNLYSVAEEGLAAFRETRDAELLAPSKVTKCSHFIAYSVQPPLGKLLGEALDGGVLLDAGLWHPFQAPRVHDAESVKMLHRQLVEAWASAIAVEPPDDWYAEHIGAVLTIYEWASERGELVIVALHPPFDRERASRVAFPTGHD